MKAKKHVAVLLSALSEEAYELLRNTQHQLLRRKCPLRRSWTSFNAEQFHLHRRDQHSGESTTQFVTDLRRLTVHCEFGGLLR